MRMCRCLWVAALFVFIDFVTFIFSPPEIECIPKQGTYASTTGNMTISFNIDGEALVTTDGELSVGYVTYGMQLKTEDKGIIARIYWDKRYDCIYLYDAMISHYTLKGLTILYGPEGMPGTVRTGYILYAIFGIALLISPLLKIWIIKKRPASSADQIVLKWKPVRLLADVPLWIAVAGLAVGGYLVDLPYIVILSISIAIYKCCRYLWLSGMYLSWEQDNLSCKYLGRHRLYSASDIWFVRYRKSPIPGWSALEVGIPGGSVMRFEEAYFLAAEAFSQKLLSRLHREA